MHVELSPEAQERVESLVASGAYPTVEAAVEAAVEAMEHPDFDGIDLNEVSRKSREAVASGRIHEVTPEFLTDLRSKVHERIRQRHPER